MVIGEPINIPKIESPSDDDINFYKNKYIDSLNHLFNKYKSTFGWMDTFFRYLLKHN